MGLTSLYVHADLLEWFENYLVEIVGQDDNICVEEICHHEFDDNIKHIVCDRSSCNEELLLDCLWRSKYQMFWISNTTFFIVIDEYTEKLKVEIETQLKNTNLFHFLSNQYERKVNWLTIKEILVFDFERNVDEATIIALEDIFWENISQNKKSPSLFFAEVLPWHLAHSNYIDIDTLALDICGEEWIRYNLLETFYLEDLLCVELANKDFRHPYYDEYLDRYLQRCIAKKLPFKFEFEHKIEYPLPSFDYKEITGYFMYKYHKYISTLYISDAINKVEFDVVAKILNIQNLQYLEDRVIDLDKKNLYSTEEIIRLCKPVHTVVYEITADYNFSNDLFARLLKLPNIEQHFSFKFLKQIEFEVPIFVEKVSWTNAIIKIDIHNSGTQNITKLGNLIRYFIQLFEDVTENVSYSFDNCILNDFDIFRNIGGAKIKFYSMKIEHVELLKLASYLVQNSSLILENCKEIYDNNIIELIQQSKITPMNISILGENSCSFATYFRVAEHIINKMSNSDLSIGAVDLPIIGQFQHIFENQQVEFFIGDKMVLLRNSVTREIVDAYKLFNNLTEEEEPPFVYD